ncbi:MAG: o-succinylbenzoate synthase [Muribaculaceae bacterium]|nr:o-succinylbenzoate synthase [Muribaculaceae bacterium]
MKAAYARHDLRFLRPAITSRSVMTVKETYFLKLWNEDNPGIYGLGECAVFRGLGSDDRPDYESRLAQLCRDINDGRDAGDIAQWSSIMFGYETAMLDLSNGGKRVIAPTPWSQGAAEIAINGLVWMGSADEMLGRIDEKIAAGFRCIKLKIGGIDFDDEIRLLGYIRSHFPIGQLELRLDANGAFAPADALSKLSRLARFGIHSIEQPIRQGQWGEMSRLCMTSPIPIALDEELIGISDADTKARMLDTIHPAYIILKPSLCGGFRSASEWIDMAEERGIGWWVTSALESNIGLNAIAQWTSSMSTSIPQGLGTGMLYANNIASPLRQIRDAIIYDTSAQWQIPELTWNEG